MGIKISCEYMKILSLIRKIKNRLIAMFFPLRYAENTGVNF